VIVNGWQTRSFNVQRGVGQGDPLSLLLFDLAIGGLANAFRQSTFLQGIPLPCRGDIMKVSIYADDTLVTFSSQGDLNEIEGILERYCYASGAKINKKKVKLSCFNQIIQQFLLR